MLFWQILIDGFAISSLYALGATGFTLIFGVTGVLNLSHGAIMVAAAVAAWAASGNFGAGAYLGAVFGVVVALYTVASRCERPVAARARRTALMVASVPELTNLTFSQEGSAALIFDASSTSSSVGMP